MGLMPALPWKVYRMDPDDETAGIRAMTWPVLGSIRHIPPRDPAWTQMEPKPATIAPADGTRILMTSPGLALGGPGGNGVESEGGIADCTGCHAGLMAAQGADRCVTCVRPCPSTPIRKICVTSELRPAANARKRPSGDHVGVYRTCRRMPTTVRRPVPSAAMTSIAPSLGPPATIARRDPSGDQAGFRSSPATAPTCLRPVPSAL